MAGEVRLAASAEAAAPRDYVLARVSDFAAHERLARRRGIGVRRLHEGEGGVGAAWSAAFEVLGARRETTMQVLKLGPEGLRLASLTAGVRGDATLALRPLSPERTLLHVDATLGAATLGARLFLGTLRLGRGELERRLQERLETFAAHLGARWAEERPGPP